MIRWKQELMGFADFGLTCGTPDFVVTPRVYERDEKPCSGIGDAAVAAAVGIEGGEVIQMGLAVNS